MEREKFRLTIANLVLIEKPIPEPLNYGTDSSNSYSASSSPSSLHYLLEIEPIQLSELMSILAFAQ